MKRPNSMRHLDDAIRRLCGGAPQDFMRARTVMANAIVASMLPDGVVKGGSALKMRFGEENTRFTTDLDTATATDPAAYAAELDSRLRSGWEGFSGRVVEKDPASPDGIPEQYVMQPYDVKLDYLGKPWCTVPLEVGHNEIGDANARRLGRADGRRRALRGDGIPHARQGSTHTARPPDRPEAPRRLRPGRSCPRSHRPPADRRQSRG